MQVILGVVSRSFKSYFYILILLFLFLFIFSLVGMELFKGKFDDFEDEIRFSYDTFWFAFVTNFQLITLENW